MHLLDRIKLVIKKYSNIHRPGVESDILIFSTPRSGSTLVEELLCTQSGMKFCDEPLNVRNRNVREVSGLNEWPDLLANPDRKLKLEKYFTKIRKNKVAFLNANPFARNYRFITNRMVFKIIHGGEDIINWFRDTFDGQIVYLIRHPIAVTLSRKVRPRLPFFLKNDLYRALFSTEQIDIAESIIRGGNDFERGIISWCLQNYPPLNCSDTRGWVIISYEELVANPESSIKHLARILHLPSPEKMIETVKKPSRTTTQSDKETRHYLNKKTERKSRYWFIRKWKKRVTTKEERSAFDLLDAFHIDAYTFGKFLPSKKYLISE